MGKLALFSLIWWLTGSPVTALIVLLVVLYGLDRRFLGLTPSLAKPIRRQRRLSVLMGQLRWNPHDLPAKLEAAHLLIEGRRYGRALQLLEEALPRVEDSAEVLYEIGLCKLKLGELAAGREQILSSLQLQPRLRYGEPYLRLAEAYGRLEPSAAADYLMRFREVQSSSSEGLYRLGRLYVALGRPPEAAQAFREAVETYRGLPRYLKRKERRWALLAGFNLLRVGG